MLSLYILCTGFLLVCAIFRVGITHQAKEATRRELKRAEDLKARYAGKIPEGAYLVRWQDMDLGQIMGGTADGDEQTFGNLGEALARAHELSDHDDEISVDIIDHSANVIASAWSREITFRSSEGRKDFPRSRYDGPPS